MIAVIVLIDQLIWRPLIAWSDRFKMEQVESGGAVSSPILHLLRNASAVKWIERRTLQPAWERLTVARSFAPRPAPGPRRIWLVRLAQAAGLVLVAAVVLYSAWQAFEMMRGLRGTDVSITLEAAGATFLRVIASLLISLVWAVPAGVAIGFNPRVARLAQPIAQIAASVPATALFPVVLLGLVRLGGGLGVGSIILMLLGTQWYILFNVIAGAMAIPSELREAADVFRFTRLQRWQTVILPGIFPYLVTGLVTASGGAWNASIVAEYFHFQGKIMTTLGLGAQISSATDSGNTLLLLLSTVVMAMLVVTVNRLVWKPLYRLAETRYRLEG
jgi:NitT/TauT family transport system permease protein